MNIHYILPHASTFSTDIYVHSGRWVKINKAYLQAKANLQLIFRSLVSLDWKWCSVA